MFGYRPLDHSDLGIYLASLDDTAPRRLISGASHGYYTRLAGSTRAYIVFERNLFLMAQEYDEQHEQVTGEARAITSKPLTTWRAFSSSHNGVIAYHAGNPNRTLGWFNREGKAIGTVGPPNRYVAISISPDGTRAVTAIVDALERRDLWLLDLTHGLSSRITTDGTGGAAVWSPDGRRVIAHGLNGSRLFEVSANGVGEERTVLESPQKTAYVNDVSPDGRFLVYTIGSPEGGFDLGVLPTGGDRKPALFLATPASEYLGQISPDGKWIAYISDESGRDEVYVRSFPASGSKWPVSNGGGTYPRWRRDGKELFFVSPGGALMAVPVRPAPQGLDFGAAAALPASGALASLSH